MNRRRQRNTGWQFQANEHTALRSSVTAASFREHFIRRTSAARIGTVRILIVDGNRDIALSLARQLRLRDFHTACRRTAFVSIVWLTIAFCLLLAMCG